jgi:hypothetical protein
MRVRKRAQGRPDIQEIVGNFFLRRAGRLIDTPVLQTKQASETIAPRSKVFDEYTFGVNRSLVKCDVRHFTQWIS